MSKQSEAKIKQGYSKQPQACTNCNHLMEELEMSPGGVLQKKHLRCGIGKFAVKKMASCLSYSKVREECQP